MFKARMVTLFVLGGLSLCFFYIWGCSFGSASGGTTSNPVGPSSGVGTAPSWAEEEKVVMKRTEVLASSLISKNVSAAAENFALSKKSEFLTLFQENIEPDFRQ